MSLQGWEFPKSEDGYLSDAVLTSSECVVEVLVGNLVFGDEHFPGVILTGLNTCVDQVLVAVIASLRSNPRVDDLRFVMMYENRNEWEVMGSGAVE